MAKTSLFTNFSLRIFLLANALAILQARPGGNLDLADIEGGSGTECPCDAGYKCEEEVCIKDPCSNDCSNEPHSPVCGSNAKTYNNECEFEKQRCLSQESWTVIYKDTCVTLPPPPENLCRKHQKRIDSEEDEVCDYEEIMRKAQSGTLVVQDVLPCYRPRCDGDKYTPLQCSLNAPKWCWCSNEEGLAIEGTLKKYLKQEECIYREPCLYNGEMYRDASLFIPDNGCGLCECLNGEYTCFQDYVPSLSGHLNASRIKQLKDELIQMFLFQYSVEDHVLIDIRHIHQHPTTVSSDIERIVLEWKFEYYDRNGDDTMTPGEEWLFQNEMNTFLQCTKFFDHVSDLMDANDDSVISFAEWESFFNVDPRVSASGSAASGGYLQLAKRSVPLSPDQLRLKRLQKNKFYYVYKQ